MRAAEIVTLYEYNEWATRRVLQAASQVSERDWAAPAALSHGSLRGTLGHALSAEWVWRQRCEQGISPTALLSDEAFPTVEALRERWDEEASAWRRYLAPLTDEALDGPVRYTNTKGKPFETTLWHILVHVVNHGTQHRSEVAAQLTDLGHSPGDLDFIMFLRERA